MVTVNTISFAKQELDRYLGLISDNGFIPKIDLNVKGDLSEFGLVPVENPSLDDQYYIDINCGKGTIYATNSRAILIGVYAFLYQIGCRFLRPSKEYEIIPTKNLSDITVKISKTASLRHRGICIEGANSIENVLDMIDWLPKIGMNSYFVQFMIPYGFLYNWYSHKNNSTLSSEKFDMEVAKGYNQQINAQIAKRGLIHHRVGHGWTCEVLGQSTLGWVSTDMQLTATQQEMSALVNGKRGFFNGIPINTNLCYSSERVIEVMSDKVVEYAKDHQEVNLLHVWVADDCNNHCECPICKDKIPADEYVAILNRIDEKLTKNEIHIKIVFLIYMDLLWAPLVETLKSNTRFILMFAPISRSFEHSYDEYEDIKKAPPYQRNKITLPRDVDENIAFLQQWKKIFSGDSFVYDYPLGRAHYGDVGYVNISKIISRDIKHLKKMDLCGYISCQEQRAFLPNALPNYVMAHTLFDVTLSFDEISCDYFKSAYGNDYEKVLNYLNRISNHFSPDYFNRIGQRDNDEIAQKAYAVEEIVDKFIPTITFNLSKTNGVVRLFWEHLNYHATYTKLMARAIYYLSRGEQDEANKHWCKFTDYICTNELKYQKALDVYRVIEVAKRYTGFK